MKKIQTCSSCGCREAVKATDPNVKMMKAGTDLYSFTPFAYTILKKYCSIRCDTCLKSPKEHGVGLTKCGICCLVSYCSAECQQKGWYDGHKFECKGFKKFGSMPEPSIRLLIRILIRLQNPFDIKYDTVNDKAVRFESLPANYDNFMEDKDWLKQFTNMGSIASAYLQDYVCITVPKSTALFRICARIAINACAITGDEGQPIGYGLYLGTAFFQHSCEPTATYNFDLTKLTVRAIKELPVDIPTDRITISFINVLQPSSLRKAEIANTYFFECQCTRCKIGMYDEEMTSLKCPKKNCVGVIDREKNSCKTCKQSLAKKYITAIEEIETSCAKEVDKLTDEPSLDKSEEWLHKMKTKGFYDSHWLMINIASVAFNACIHLKEWEKAYQYGTLTAKGLKLYLTRNFPIFGITTLKMAKLCWFLGKDVEAQKYLYEASVGLTISHGQESNFYKNNLCPLQAEVVQCFQGKKKKPQPKKES